MCVHVRWSAPSARRARELQVSIQVACSLANPLKKISLRLEVDSGTKPGVTTDQSKRMKELERENRELKRANEILKKAAAFFAHAELDRKPK